jgi:hypothetical protein
VCEQGCIIHIQMYFLYNVFVQLYTCMVELTVYTLQVYNNYAHHARMKRTIQYDDDDDDDDDDGGGDDDDAE